MAKQRMALTEILQSLRRRYGVTWGTLCSKSPGPDGIHPWVLNEIKWEIMSSVTRIYNRYLKTANIPEDCEVINMVSHMCGVVCVCVWVSVCESFLHVLGSLEGGRDKRGFLFFLRTKKDSLIKQRIEEFYVVKRVSKDKRPSFKDA